MVCGPLPDLEMLVGCLLKEDDVAQTDTNAPMFSKWPELPSGSYANKSSNEIYFLVEALHHLLSEDQPPDTHASTLALELYTKILAYCNAPDDL